MKAEDEIIKILSLLDNDVNIHYNTSQEEPKLSYTSIHSSLFYSRSINEYLIVSTPIQEINLNTLRQQLRLDLNQLNKQDIELIYPVKPNLLSPINLIDDHCRQFCSIVYFSNSFNDCNLLLQLTYSDTKLEISFFDFKQILELSGVKIRQFDP
jgi:hypothetical protein